MGLKKRIQEWWLRKRLNWAVLILKKINVSMKRMGWSRQMRRQFWRDFSKSERLQNEIYQKLLGEG